MTWTMSVEPKLVIPKVSSKFQHDVLEETTGDTLEDHDNESFYEFEFQTSKLSPLIAPVSGESPAPDKLLISNGRIVPLKNLHGCDLSPVYCEGTDEQLENSEDVKINSSAGQQESSRIEKEKLIDLRRTSSFFDSTVLNGFVKLKKLIKNRAGRITQRLNFTSEANTHNTKVNRETKTVAAAAAKSWTSIFFNRLLLKSDSNFDNYDDKRQLKPKVVEINGQGPINEALDALITAGRLSTDSKTIESGSRQSSGPASPLHWNLDNRCEERERSITSAISFCKRSSGANKRDEINHYDQFI